MEQVRNIDEIQHPSARETLRFMNIAQGVEIHHDGDLPAMSGLGSSSAFTVGLLNALYALKGTIPGKIELALNAIHIEQKMIKENVGSQDQIMAAFGGFNQIEIGKGEPSIQVKPITINGEKLALFQKSLMLFFTGFSRRASEIAGEQIKETPNKKKTLHEMYQMVFQAISILNGNDLTDFGKLLHETWCLKKSLTNKISTTEIDDIYTAARSAGALGGKLLGAGGGGFILFFAPPEVQTQIKKSLNKLLYVPFQFENRGSQIIFYEPEKS